MDVLDLADYVGEEVEVSLAGGIRIKAPQLVLPSMSVQAMETENVKAVVLKESQPGVDGCIGLSFLNRFMYCIENARLKKLLLKPIGASKDHRSSNIKAFVANWKKVLSFLS